MTAEVFLWGTRIGIIVQESPHDFTKFQYDEKFLKSGIEVAPLMMPLSSQVFRFPELNVKTFHGLPGLLADSLPDKFGTKLIERYLMESGRNSADFSAIEKLCYIGKRGMGALEYVPATKMDITDETIDIDSLVRLASDVLTERSSLHISNREHMMEQMIKVGTSAGGARAKAIVAWNEETNDIRSGQIDAGGGYGYWIIKFDGVDNNKDKSAKADSPSYTRIEYAYHLMAKAAGIDMSECRLYEENGRYHFMTKRFDRNEESGKKIHMQTLGALAHYDYNEPGAHSYEQVANILYRLKMQQKEVEQLYRRMIFNVVTRNQDDHVKNISFLMDMKGKWSLAPAYDITYACEPDNIWLRRHQMSMNGKCENLFGEDFLACGKKMNISKLRCEKIISEVMEAVSRWSVFAEEANISEKTMLEIQKNQIRQY